MNAYAFEELTACFVFGDLKGPQTWTSAHRQCADPEWGRELGTPWKTTSSIVVNRKKGIGSHHLGKGWTT